ncbi:MAG: methyl-accepting chemotaxis protein [Candidatus Nitricoxidivorans perseverans]|uniref:Methyl-accepting chemotaxis protein n=1 Tax=Candidatus Nitricoxidivorans perseverans TaxID=2975601 RepID=A0AA49FJJ0_9PROT|nr:MAG: methyl-accepting chemotaxis protein [Candidatus Nitricoxidivorans perseverans]
MIRSLNNLSFRFIVMASLGAPLLLLWVCGYYTWDSWRTYRIMTVTIKANNLADRVIAAAGLQAIERGMTASLLSAPGPASEAARARVASLRADGDALWREADTLAGQMESESITSESLPLAHRQAAEAHARLAAARQRVDASLLKAGRDIQAAEWIPVMTDFINRAARLRINAFGGSAFPPEITYPNLTAKHSAWLASEYAGLERATVATIINGNAPASPEAMQQLKSFRQTLESSLSNLLFVREAPGTDPRIVAAIAEMEKHFLGSFDEIRRRLYAEMGDSPKAADGRHYHLTGQEWFAASTAAIDTIRKVSESYSKAGNDAAQNSARVAVIQTIGYAGLFLVMVAITFLTTTLLLGKVRQLGRLKDSMMEFATGQGDLTRRLDAETMDEVGQTSAAFNQFAGKLQEIIRETRGVVFDLSGSAEKLAAASDRIRNGSHSQREISASTATAVEAVTASIGQVAENAHETLASSREAGELAEEGARIVHGVSDEMAALAGGVADTSRRVEALGERSREIGGIVGVIREIADQTNLLALNAAIEAARAGEQGRGFAVVADEVRKLAERTGAATVDISRTIDTIQGDTRAVVEAMRTSGARVGQGVAMAAQAAQALSKINEGARQTESRVDEIARAMREQSTAGGEIARNVDRIAGMAEENDQAVGETTQDAQRLQQLADSLQRLVEKFKV